MTISPKLLRALGISGSASPNSRSRVLIEYTLAHLEALGVTVDLLDLLALPADALLARRKDALVDAAIAQASQAAILVLGTPIYRASYTGQLKAFLDLFPRGMGGGIATWLLFRAADRSLSLFSLVVPSCSETPIHDHLAWGFVGLYRGEQAETVYQRTDDGAHDDHAHLEIAEINALKPGDFYTLLPPDGDIHAVRTTSEEASISISSPGQ